MGETYAMHGINEKCI